MVKKNNRVFLSLGGNLGNVYSTFTSIIKILSTHLDIEVIATSSLLETRAWGGIKQPNFFNLGLEVNTKLGPFDLLDELLAIESSAGRLRYNKWGPRILDIDILFWEGVHIEDPRLFIPHKYLLQRDFAVALLADLAPTLSYKGKSFKQWSDELGTENILRVLKISSS